MFIVLFSGMFTFTEPNGTTMNTTKTERLGDVITRQAVITEPMQKLMDEHGPDTMVTTTTMNTPFGNYLINIEVDRTPEAAVMHWTGPEYQHRIQKVLDTLKANGITDKNLGLLEDQEPKDPIEEQQMIVAAIRTIQGLVPQVEGVSKEAYFDILWAIIMERISNPEQVIVPNN